MVDANIRTMDQERPRAATVGVWQGRVVGVDDEIAGLAARRTVSLSGATVLPGFHDAHCHTTSVGVEAGNLALDGAVSCAAALDRIAEYARGLGSQDWVIATGYLDRTEPDRYPTRFELDAAAGGRPVWVTHRSGHSCAVSSAVLSQLPSPIPAELVPFVFLDERGVPTGRLDENAMDLVKNLIGPGSVQQLAEALRIATGTYVTEGITAYTEAGIGCPGIDHSPIEVAAYQLARDNGWLQTRAQLMVYSEMLHELAGHRDDRVDFGLDLGARTGLGDRRLSLGAMKIWVDGSGTAGTAAISGTDHEATGLVDDPARMTEKIRRAHRSGWQIAAHAMGDVAIDLVLDALEGAGPRDEIAGRRHRIEHGGLIRNDQLGRIQRLGLCVVVQPEFISSFGDLLLAGFGSDRIGDGLRAGSLLDRGITVAASSDRPVVPGSPLRGIADMIGRLTESGAPFGPDERVSAEAAIAAYTTGAAWAAHWDEDLGRIRPGMLCDLVVLADDPVTVGTDRIADISVLATLLDGEIAYDTGLFTH